MATALSLPGSVTATTSGKRNRQVRYVFLFIGDGMGKYQRRAATAYLRKTTSRPRARLVMDQLPVRGEARTSPAGGGITDSAASGTALATGHKTKNGRISMDVAGKKSFPTIAEVAKRKGMKVGIISSVSIDHATPACFYAHVPSRGQYSDIARAAVDTKTVDFFGGGGFLGQRNDDGSDNLERAKKKDMVLIRTKRELAAAKPGKRIFAFNHRPGKKAGLPWVHDSKADDMTLAEITKHGIRLLDNPKGFFMMVEGGKIDWACHANDLKSTVRQTLAFDEAVLVAKKFAEHHTATTLLVVTADHETGGLSLAKGTKREDVLAGYRFSRHGHSDANVPTTAAGVGAKRFKGTHDNTDIAKWIIEIMGMSR